jgi:hypothetical protein
MSIQRTGINEPDMSCAISLAQTLERRERSRLLSVPEARRSIARKLRIGVGTFENLVRGRVKRVDAAIRDRLQALLVRELEDELARLSHELEMARQGGVHPASEHISAIETHLSQARALMQERPR